MATTSTPTSSPAAAAELATTTPSTTAPIPSSLLAQYLNADHLAGLTRTHAVTIAATSAAITSVVCGYPFDSIKTRMQAFRYDNTMACVRSTFHAEGLAGFYRGVMPVAASISVLRSISFSLYNGGKQEISALLPEGTTPLTSLMISSSISGAMAGSVVATLNSPVDFIKLQKQLERIVVTAKPTAMADMVGEAVTSAPTAAAGLGEGASAAAAAGARGIDAPAMRTPSHGSGHGSASTSSLSAPPKIKSTTEWARHIVELKGPSGLYSGYSMHLVRDAIGTGMYFCGYETCKHLLSTYVSGAPAGPLTYMMAGGLAGSLSWIVLFPIDVTKSVLQREALQRHPKYSTALQFVKMRWAKGGIRGFYNGIGPQLLRSFPVHSINFLVYENVVKWCRTVGVIEGDTS
ncbi:mitochondrial carrier domain-containing protein [Powellomyces hirtus]|nr:mitochondrial carrier domain-containing protein [Powellomyces hirtus]